MYVCVVGCMSYNSRGRDPTGQYLDKLSGRYFPG